MHMCELEKCRRKPEDEKQKLVEAEMQENKKLKAKKKAGLLERINEHHSLACFRAT